MLLEWLASDRDRDALVYSVQYSHDNGATWETLTADYPRESLEVNPEKLRGSDGSQGLIRVIASDGFLTASDTSDATFTVPDSPPSVHILLPYASQVFGGEQTIVFKAMSNDLEDRFLDDTGLVWRSNVDGVLGFGIDLALVATDLSPGDHEITLTGTDSGGSSATDMVHLKNVGLEFPAILISQLSASPAMLWPPNGHMVPVELSVDTEHLPQFSEPTCQINSVSATEIARQNGPPLEEDDWEITGDLSLELRAAREGKGGGRIYAIAVECVSTDGEESTTISETVEIVVALDQRRER